MNQIITIIRRHWVPLLGLNSALLAATLYTATIYLDMTFAPVWKATAKLNLPQMTSGLNVNLGTLGNVQNSGSGFSKEINPLQIQASIITSDTVMERVRTVDPQKNLYPTPSSYKQLFKATPQEMTTLIALEVQGSSPELARQRLLMLIDAYQQRLNDLRRNDNVVRAKFTQPELEQARINLIQAQNALTNFKQSTGLVDSNEQSKALISTISNLKATQATILAQVKANDTQAMAAAARLGITPGQAMNSLRLGENKEYQAIREKLSQAEAALADARSKFKDDSPPVQSLLQKRQELVRTLNQQIKVAIPNASAGVDTTLGGNGNTTDNRIQMITDLIRTQTLAKGQRQQANQLQLQIDKLNTQLRSISAHQAQLSYLQRQYDIAEGVYKGIIAQVQQAKTNPFNVYPNVQTLDDPITDPAPSKPKRWLVVIGGILAAISSSVALVLFRESRNPLLSPEDLQQLDYPVLGSIPRLKHPGIEMNLEANVEIEFQRLASTMLTLKNQCIMVTSATSEEGKTTVTLGLALALVSFGLRVLIVDGDLKQAHMSRRLGHLQIESKAGSQVPISIAPGLDLLPALPIAKAKIAEFFACGDFERCLSMVRESGHYDYVLVDSAPVGLASETNLMSAVVRNVLFVVRSGSSDRYMVMNSFEQLTRHHAQIIGLIVNGVESRAQVYHYKRQRELTAA